MFLHRVNIRKTREFQQKRPAVRNTQAVSKVADWDQSSEKSTLRVFGVEHVTKGSTVLCRCSTFPHVRNTRTIHLLFQRIYRILFISPRTQF